ncbi:MAG TPA: hypothetical protein VF508_10690 [Pyrinomonadaceae bacterium]|jgi:hypothetical protein
MLERPARLNAVFEGFPVGLVPARAFEQLTRFCLDLDRVGRLDAQTAEPLVDEHTLVLMLREFVGQPEAERLVGMLGELPGAAFRPAQLVGPPTTEVSWFELAEHVVVFDTRPEAAFSQLELPARPRGADVVSAVHKRFPSLEEELLTPDQLPARISELLSDEAQFDAVLQTLVRQLGWWAALATVLLVAPAAVTRSERFKGQDRNLAGNTWPLAMCLLAAAIGGWTLTVVGSCVLAPAD